eukprot:scaffold946_cov94-Skeletonema_menzelii.AAC.3
MERTVMNIYCDEKAKKIDPFNGAPFSSLFCPKLELDLNSQLSRAKQSYHTPSFRRNFCPSVRPSCTKIKPNKIWRKASNCPKSISMSKIDKYYFLSMSNANNSSNGLHIISSSTWKVV